MSSTAPAVPQLTTAPSEVAVPSEAAVPVADTALLVVDDVSMYFPTADSPVVAVDHLSLAVRQGEFLSVIGPSGCGKSTLFDIIGGLQSGYQGRVTVGGETIHGPHPAIGMVFQEESTFPWRTVLDNVSFPLELLRLKRKERHEL